MRKFPLALLALATGLSIVSLAGAEVTQKNGVRVSISGDLRPRRLPRTGTAPVSVSLAAKIGSTATAALPQLERIEIALNSHGRLRMKGLPKCRVGHIDPSTTADALVACGRSLVGEGHFSADVRLPEQSPFPSEGKVLVFSGTFKGQPALIAHIYGTRPAPTSFVLPFVLQRTQGTFGTILVASLPRVTGNWGFVTGLSMKLRRTVNVGGRKVGFISTGCPAPDGFQGTVFPMARVRLSLSGGTKLSTVLDRSCAVR